MDLEGKIRLPILLILLVSILLYANTLPNQFVYDDQAFIVNNPYIKNLTKFPCYFTRKESLSESGHEIYRPLRTLSYAIDFFFWKLNPLGYHLTNIFLHSLNGVLVYLVLSLLLKKKILSLCITLLFISHPVQTETVAWISSRGDLLYSFFFLLAFLSFIKKRYLCCIFSYLFSLFSKESAVVFPLILILYEICFKEKEDRLSSRYYLYLFGLIAAYFLLRYAVLGSFSQRGFWGGSFYSNLLTSIQVFIYYLKLSLWPISLKLIYNIGISYSLLDPKVLSSLSMLFSLIIFAIVSWRGLKPISFWMGWFLITIIPTSNIIPLIGLFSEHFLYLPLLGYLAILILVIDRLSKISIFKGWFWLPSLLIIFVYSIKTIERNKDWRDDLTLWSKTVEATPQSFKAHFGLGYAYLEKGLYKEAIEEFQMAINLDKPQAEIYVHLGMAYDGLKMQNEAMEFYEKALKFNSLPPGVYGDIANAYYKRGLFKEAMEKYKNALDLNSNLWQAHYGLGNVYNMLSDIGKAIEEYKIALSLNPMVAEIYYSLGTIYAQQGKSEAIEFLKKAIELKPNFAEAHYNLAVAYSGALPQKKDLARKHLDIAIGLGYKPDTGFIDYINQMEEENH